MNIHLDSREITAMNIQTSIIGVDGAAQDKNVGLALGGMTDMNAMTLR